MADFILNTLDDNGMVFHNSMYARVLNLYTKFYDEGLLQNQILARLRDSEDPETSAVTRDLLVDKYNLTVKNFENSLTSAETVLATYVPKSLIKLQLLNVELDLKSLQKELLSAQDAGRQEELMRKITELSRMKSSLASEFRK